jgi:hypothetical protein
LMSPSSDRNGIARRLKRGWMRRKISGIGEASLQHSRIQ